MSQKNIFAEALKQAINENDAINIETTWRDSKKENSEIFNASWESAGENPFSMTHGLDEKDKQSVTILKSLIASVKINDYLTNNENSETFKITVITHEDKFEWTVECQKIEHKQLGSLRK